MTLQQLLYAVEVAKNSSINKASQNLFISQPTLSISIKELEDEIGFHIFERSRKGISVTNDGIEFLRHAESLVKQLDYMKEIYSIKNMRSVARFQVSSQHYAFVVDAFIKFMDDYKSSRFQFSIKETKTLAAIDDVYTRKSVIAFIFLTYFNEKLLTQILNKKSIKFNQLASIKPHVFIRKGHPLCERKSITIDTLYDYPMIVYEQEGNDLLSEEFISLKNHSQVIYAQDRGTTNNIISNTDSFNIGTGYLIKGVISDDIISLPLDGEEGEMHIGWIHLQERELTPEVLRFVELAKDSLIKNHPHNTIQE